MASPPGARAPKRACVQNHSASATAVASTRQAAAFHREEEAASGELTAELLDPPQVQLSGTEVGHGLDPAELVGAGLPERRQVGFRELREHLLQGLFLQGVEH